MNKDNNSKIIVVVDKNRERKRGALYANAGDMKLLLG